jgi:hypothetical protein
MEELKVNVHGLAYHAWPKSRSTLPTDSTDAKPAIGAIDDHGEIEIRRVAA